MTRAILWIGLTFPMACPKASLAAPDGPPAVQRSQAIKMSITPLKPISHVGLGFIGGFVLSADPGVTYSGPGELPVKLARGNASFGYAIHGEKDYKRYGTFTHTRRKDAGSSVHLVISDSWENAGWPYANEANRVAWEALVYKLIGKTVDTYGLDHVVVDIFNEPESLNRGGVDQAKIDSFLDTRPVSSLEYYLAWRNTVRYIRTLGPVYSKVRIAGPSTSGYNHFILEFLSCAHSDSVLPDIVNWHELDYESIFDLDANVSKVREYMAGRDIPARPISINEYAGKRETYSPAVAVGFFSKLENSGVVASAKSCWERSDGANECGVGSYNGLYARKGKTFRPRSIWWAYKWYAEASGNALAAPVSGPNEAFFGSYDSTAKRLQMVFANVARAGAKRLAPGDIVGRRIMHLGPLPGGLSGRCRATLERIKPSESKVYAGPEILWRRTLKVDSTFRLEMPAIHPENVYRFRLDRI